jgi:hypothetical protein
MPRKHSDLNSSINGGYARFASNYHFGKHVCPVCDQPVRAGRGFEHRDCQAELDRRADAAIPNPRKGIR